MDNLNFSEFLPLNQEEWRQLVKRELKGKSPDDILWSWEGKSFDPLLTDRVSKRSFGAAKSHTSWLVRQNFYEVTTVDNLLTAITDGIDVVGTNVQVFSKHAQNILHALEGKSCELNLRCFSLEDIQQSFEQTEKVSFSVKTVLEWPIFASGLITRSEDELRSELKMVHGLDSVRFVVDSSFLRDKGARLSQELSWALTGGHAILLRLIDAGWMPEDAAKIIIFNPACGGDYYTEMCKVKVLRKLWAVVVSSYTEKKHLPSSTLVEGQTSTWNKPAVDVDTNLIRLSIEAMALISGGVDVLAVGTHNKSFDGDALRWARNIQWLLKHEALLDAVIDPMEGSYFLEHLCELMADRCWSIFQEIDPGFETDLASGAINQQISDQAKRDREQVASGDRVVVGVNKFAAKDSKTQVVGVETMTTEYERQKN